MLLVTGAVIAITTGIGIGAMTRLERRDGCLWGQVPKKGLCAVGHADREPSDPRWHRRGVRAHVAAGIAAILLMLGLNRAAQSSVVVSHAVAAGIPLAREGDGKLFGASWFTHATQPDG